MSNKNIIATLTSAGSDIVKYLNKIIGLSSNNFNYKTFGTDIEGYLAKKLVSLLVDRKIIKDDSDYVLAPNKNYFPDLELRVNKPSLVIEFKSGNVGQLRKGKWVRVKNSEDDMGTLNEWPNKIRKFGAENIYFAFVVYNFNDRIKEILDIKIAPFYEFLDLNKSKVLKYREKDGNLRPKDFDAKPRIKSPAQFEELFTKTVIYRSKRIIKKHKLIIKNITEL